MKIKLSENGPQLSRIVAGVMKWGVWGADYSPEKVFELIEACMALEVTTFDHADIYGHYTTEELFGKAIKGSSLERGKYQLVTKCGINLLTPNRPSIFVKSYDTSENHILNSVDRSLKNLETDYIDLLLIHRPSPLMHPQEIANAFQKLKDNKKVLHFGVSNFTASQYQMINQVFPICTNQVEASLTHTDPMTDGVFDQAISLAHKPMAWSPLGAGKLFEKELPANQPIYKAAKPLMEKYGLGLDQLLLAWLLKHPAMILPVLGTSKASRVADSVKALEVTLEDQEWFSLLEAANGQEVP